MSREQLTESQGQFAEGSPETAGPGNTSELPPHIYQQVVQIRPGDAAGLRMLLAQYPDLSEAIAQVASHYAGMSTVKQAIVMQSVPDDTPMAMASTQADIRPGGAFELDGGSSKPATPEVAPVAATPAAAAPATAETAQGEPRPADLIIGRDKPKENKADPAWVAGAQRYNDAHPTLVDEFNELTDHRLVMLDDDSQLKPQAVASWQKVRGLVADGKIGPQTVAAARADRAKSDVVAQSDAGPKGELIDV